MKRVLTAIVLIPIVLIVALRAPVPVLAGFVAVVAVLAIREFLELSGHYGIQPLRKPVYVLTLVLLTTTGVFGLLPTPLLALEYTMYTAGLIAVLTPFLFLAIAMWRQDLRTGYPAAAAAVLAMLYIALPLTLIIQVRQMWAGAFLLVYLLVVVWVGDTAAYYVGRAVGRHKLAPRISPGKTWEGTVASFVAAVAAGSWIFTNAAAVSRTLLNLGLIVREQGYFAQSVPPLWEIALFSGLINVAAQFGDLVESLIKRGAGVKDSGTLLPGHGGMLDRIDALLFAAPVLWYYAALQVLTRGHF